MNDYKHRNDCRLCGSTRLEHVLPIKPSAIGDAFVPKDRLNEPQKLYPLDCYLCLDCGHLQNLDVVNPDILFREYTYRTSVSLGLVEHFRKYAESVVSGLEIAPGNLVVEIGSNDGSLLKAFKALGMEVQGIDPAREIALRATSEGIPTVPDFFTSKIAKQIREERGQASVFCANNVFAHIDDMNDILVGIRSLLKDDGVFVFEVSYIVDMIDNMVFDTIYHEHVSHHALIPLETFLNKHDMTLFDVIKIPSKGGSIRCFAQPLSVGKRPRTQTFADLVAEEIRREVGKPAIYRDWFDRIEERKRETLAIVDEMLAQGKTVAAYGASTTTTTLLYHFELENRIAFIADDNPLKHGMYSPGAHIPVVPSEELMTRKPDLVVILAWVYAEPIIKRNQAYIDAGGAFLVPLPTCKIVDKNSQA